jgi:hypothetical protein
VLLFAIHFVFQRQLPGVAPCAFFFENFLNMATCMAGSREMELPYAAVGNPELAQHDWATKFTQMNLPENHRQIAALVRVIGWLGMIAVVVWLAWKTQAPARPGDPRSVRPYSRV